MGLFRSATIARARLPASDFFRRAPLIQQFAEFLHLASTAISGKAIPVGVPLFEVARTNPMAIAAVHADVDHAPAWTIVTAAFVSHDSPGRVKRRITIESSSPVKSKPEGVKPYSTARRRAPRNKKTQQNATAPRSKTG